MLLKMSKRWGLCNFELACNYSVGMKRDYLLEQRGSLLLCAHLNVYFMRHRLDVVAICNLFYSTSTITCDA